MQIDADYIQVTRSCIQQLFTHEHLHLIHLHFTLLPIWTSTHSLRSLSTVNTSIAYTYRVIPSLKPFLTTLTNWRFDGHVRSC